MSQKNRKQSLKEKLSEMLELPKEIIMDIPKITFIGDKQMIVENYKGIIEYEESKIRLNTQIGILRIEGNMLSIEEITSDDILVKGDIRILEYLK
jgi:sporulation protein YqfC